MGRLVGSLGLLITPWSEGHRTRPRQRNRIVGCLALLGLVSCVPARADVLDTIAEAFKDLGLFQGVEITGQNTLTFQGHLVDGSQTSYENQRWDTSTLERQTSLHLSGPVWKEFAFQADLSSSGYGTSYSRWIVGYAGSTTQVFFGDLNINLSGNEFASFSKSLKGYQFDQRLPNRGLLRAFYSSEKGITRNQTLSGNNTSGPYFLTYTPVIEGSEVVKVNERIMKFGSDYTLDYQSGILRFEPVGGAPEIIPDTAVIAVSYQSYGAGASPSQLKGFRAEMPLLGERVLIGLTHAEQTSDTPGSDTVGYQEDIYQGSGSTGPFDTIYRPIIANGTRVIYDGQDRVIEQSLVVLVDNAEQAESVDYDAYRSIGRIIFRRAVPPTSMVVIRYFYDLTSNIQTGNVSVTGVDLNYRINDQLTLRADLGQSDSDNGNGTAMQANLNLSFPSVDGVISYRNIQPEFSYLNSVGFYKQEKGLDAGLNWRPLDHVRIYSRYSDLDSSSGYSFGYTGGSVLGTLSALGSVVPAGVGTRQTDTTTTLSVNTKRMEYDVDLDFPSWPMLKLSREELTNAGASSGDSDMTADTLQFSYSPAEAPYRLQGSYYTTVQNYAGSDSVDPYGSRTTRYDLSGNYSLGSRLTLSASMGHNESNSLDDAERSQSDNSSVTLNWSPTNALDISIDHRVAESLGRLSYYGGTGSYDSYYGGIGGGTGGYVPPSTGDDDDDDDDMDRYEDVTSQLRVSYRPSQRLGLDFSLGQRKYTSGGTVGYLADSDQTTYSISTNWMASEDWSLGLMWSSDEMNFLEEGAGAINNETLSLGLTYSPSEKPYTAGLSINLQDGSSPTYVGFGDAQKMFMVDNKLFDVQTYFSYRLGEQSSVSVRAGLSDFAGGYADFEKNNFEIAYERTLSNLARLSVGYRYLRNLSRIPDDPRLGYTSLTPPSDNYAANTFMVTLSTNFQSGLGGSRSQQYTGYGGTVGAGLGSFGGYRAGQGFGSSGSYGSYGSYGGYGSSYYAGGSPYGTSYNAFDNLQSGGGYQTGSQLPGYGIFDTTQRRDTGDTGVGLGDFRAGDQQRGVDGLRRDGPPAPGARGALEDLPEWLDPEDYWEYWPLGFDF